MNNTTDIPRLVRDLYAIVEALEERFPGRAFTLDGHLVGSIGEVLAAHHYGLELLPASSQGHDAKAPNGKLVQIKATQRNSIGIRSEPEHLIVLQLMPTGETSEVYNGPGLPAWSGAGKMQKNGQRAISVSKLRALMTSVGPKLQLKRVND